MDRAHPPLELVPLDEPKPDALAGIGAEIEIGPMGTRDTKAAAASTDRFLKEATQQYEEGHIDQPLWDRALLQAGNDKAAATESYLRARATVLRLLDRARRARRADATSAMPAGPGDTLTPGVATLAAGERARLPATITRHRNAIFAAAALVPLGFFVWLLSGYLGSGSTASDAAVTRPVPLSEQSVARFRAPEAPANPKAVGDSGSRRGATPEFLNKIQQLNDAGNWNVLVLYAVEWTRLEPTNAAAWNQLRAGYANMRQYVDALDAANKAVELAPEDSRMWRNLGLVLMDLNDPAEALRAFDKALAVSPDDPTARCLRMSVAQLAAAHKDARTSAKPSASFDSPCRGSIEPVAAR